METSKWFSKPLRATYLYLCVREKKKTNKELTKERKEKPKKKKRFSVVCLLGMGIYGQRQPLNYFDSVYKQVER